MDPKGSITSDPVRDPISKIDSGLSDVSSVGVASGRSGKSGDSSDFVVDSGNSGSGFVDNSKNALDPNGDGNVLVTDEGHLLINNARLEVII